MTGQVKLGGTADSDAQLWCPHPLPDGRDGHRFSARMGTPLLCRDRTCPYFGTVVYQCPVHRSCMGQVVVPSGRVPVLASV
jgi:hypothetical protein